MTSIQRSSPASVSLTHSASSATRVNPQLEVGFRGGGAGAGDVGKVQKEVNMAEMKSSVCVCVCE